MIIPANPVDFLRGRTVFIMGAGRSGTTILSQIIGSMKPVVYIFEPVLLRLMLCFVAAQDIKRALRSVFFEDYVLPRVQGRRLDCNPDDKTFYGNFDHLEALTWRGKMLNRRADAIVWLNHEAPIWLVKLPELQPLAMEAAELFPDARFIHIIRDGLEVVVSSCRLNWFGTEWCKVATVEWTNEHGAPTFLDQDSQDAWPEWTPETRAASVWRRTVQAGLAFEGHAEMFTLRYEELAKEPGKLAIHFARWLNVRVTDITESHINRVKEWEPRRCDRVKTLEKILPPEKEKFLSLMAELGYPAP